MVTVLSRTVDDAAAQTVSDRLDLADQFLEMADRLLRSRGTDMSRPAIARYYYAMYHAMRAVAFESSGGDDHQQHTELSVKGIPTDFPQKELIRNALKDARTLRNEADYEQYPQDRTYFRSEAKKLSPVAANCLSSARQYVRSKGNKYA